MRLLYSKKNLIFQHFVVKSLSPNYLLFIKSHNKKAFLYQNSNIFITFNTNPRPLNSTCQLSLNSNALSMHIPPNIISHFLTSINKNQFILGLSFTLNLTDSNINQMPGYLFFSLDYLLFKRQEMYLFISVDVSKR